MRHSEQMRKQSRHDQNTVEYGLTAEQASDRAQSWITSPTLSFLELSLERPRPRIL